MFLAKTKALAFAALLILPGGCLLRAQDATQNPPASDEGQQAPSPSGEHHRSGTHLSVTGCLKSGDQAGEYSVVGDDGKKYGLWSTTVKLDEHLGQKVTVTGRSKKPSKNDPDEAAALTVTGLKRISTTCP